MVELLPVKEMVPGSSPGRAARSIYLQEEIGQNTVKILWHSNAPWVPSGYGVQTKHNIRQLVKMGHEVVVSAFHGLESGKLRWENIPVLPGGIDKWGNDIVDAHYQVTDSEIVITLVDIWILNPEALKNTRWCPWFPIDHEPLSAAFTEPARQSFQPIVCTRWGEKLAQEAGLDPLYVPYSIDGRTYRPVDKKKAREALGIQEDIFLFGMVAANASSPSRKSFPQVLEAFARFYRRHPEARMYIHTDMIPRGKDGLHLLPICEYLGIKEVVGFPNGYGMIAGYTDEDMVNLYNSFDVLLSPSMAEGFGVPIIEAQACGTPVVVGDWTGMSEICFAGYKIPKELSEPFWTPVRSNQFLPHISAIEEAMEWAYNTNLDSLEKEARTGALQYAADVVGEKYWRPALRKIQQKIEETK